MGCHSFDLHNCILALWLLWQKQGGISAVPLAMTDLVQVIDALDPICDALAILVWVLNLLLLAPAWTVKQDSQRSQ